MLVEVETAIWNDSDREVPTNAADGTNAPAEQLFRQNDTAMTDVKHIAENFIMGSVLSVECILQKEDDPPILFFQSVAQHGQEAKLRKDCL